MLLRLKQKIRHCDTVPNSQAGVTLLLAILLLSSILAISFSLATVLIVEVKTSSDIVKSEPAFFAAESLSEVGVFNVKRNVPAASSTIPTAVGAAQVSSFTLNPLAPPVQQVQVLPSSNSYANTTARYILYNPSNSDCTNTSNHCGGYGRIRITYLATAANEPMSIYLCKFDPGSTVDDCEHTTTDCPIGDSCNFPVNNIPLAAGATWDSYTYLGSLLNADSQYELRLVYGGPNTGHTIYTQLESYDTNGSTRKGLPYLNQKGVEVNTTNGDTTRSIRTIVPTQ